ncbi:MAG: beta-lactamase family protein [Gammaproteobacteria bacterium]|nr:beta-lactamase family protein [Gammaproteobacteria bacterium]MDH3804913.1 beta-lactamase family protein [Gammaproteobacteria bacterium]
MKCGRIALLSLALLLQACGKPPAPETSTRTLSYDLLMAGTGLAEPLPLVEFSPAASKQPATNVFSGRLLLATDSQSNHFDLQVDELNFIELDRPGMQELPPFDFEFIQSGDLLVPLRQGPIGNQHNWWEFVLLPGRVWDEDSDNGFSRAALPFALKERREDCIHNGLMSFLFSDDGTVSKVAFQLSNQTCRYLQFEMRGLLTASYEPGNVEGGADAIAEIVANQASRLPQWPIARLANDYPGSNSEEFGSIEEIDPADMTVFGLIIDGVHYVGGCNTAHGTYPYCDEMALPSSSVAKSLVGGLGLMLAEKAYPGTASARITDNVPECGEDWNTVTIEHALDMTTGHYDSPEAHVDEDAAIVSRFFTGEDHATKIDFACNEFPRKSEPGERWVYQTWATYLAGTAINNRMRAIEGADADFYADLIVEKLWKPLQLSSLIHATRRTNDIVAQPFTGFGLTLVRDDVAKLAVFLGAEDGRLNGEEVLDGKLFDAIKQRLPDDSGMQAESERIRYNNGFRSFDVSEILGCDNPTWLVTMSGFGGINIVLMPNDTAYYYFSDGNVHRFLHAVRESHNIRSMCQ